MIKNNLIFVDCEASGPCIGKGDLTEFGAVHYPSMKTFYGDMRIQKHEQTKLFMAFDMWLSEVCEDYQPLFVSDNPAFDWQWINYYFHHLIGKNPFGWSARRIGDYYAGLAGNFRNATKWKKWRITKHTHFPVDDAMGNAEAFQYMEEHKEEIRLGVKLGNKLGDSCTKEA